MRAEEIFALAYLICTAVAVAAIKSTPDSGPSSAAPFWLRIAIICGLFAILRFVDAQMAVSGAFRDLTRDAHLTNWQRPGPYLMLLAIAAFGFALAGFFFFRPRSLHQSTNTAALAIVLLVLLAIAHSLALYVTGNWLQLEVGSLTVSRILEAFLLIVLASSGLWFIADAKRGSASSRS